MQNSKLIATIKNIKKKELGRIKKFLNSDLNNESKEITQQRKLFNLLIEHYQDFSVPSLDKKKVFKKIYKSTFDSNKLNRLNGRLLSSIRYYLIHLSENKNNPILDNLKESKLYLDNADEAMFNKSITRLEGENEKLKPNDNYFLNAYLIENEKLNFNYLYNQRKGELNIPSTLEKLDQFYFKKRLEMTLSLLAQNKFAFKVDTDKIIHDYDYIIKYFENQIISKSPIFEIYKQAINMLKEDDKMAYEKVKSLLAKHQSDLTLDESKNLHTLARNFCIQQYSLGQDEYLNEAFKCFQHDLEQGYLYHNRGILSSTMQAIVKLGLRLDKSKWVLNFLKDHELKIIGTREPTAIYNYNLAEYYFYEGKFEKSLDLVHENFEDIHYKTSSKRLIIKSLYETESPLLESKINAFKIYIFRISHDKFTPLHKEGNNQFIDILKQIYNPATLSNSKRIRSILKKINNTKSIADRPWLIKKLQ